MNRVRTKPQRQLDGLLHRFGRFPGKSDHETAVDQDAGLSGIFHEPLHLFNPDPFARFVQYALIAALKSDAELPASRGFHDLQGFQIRIDPGIGDERDADAASNQRLRKRDQPFLVDRQCVVFEKDRSGLRKGFLDEAHLFDDILDAAQSIPPTGHHLRIYAKPAEERAPPACDQRHHRVDCVRIEIVGNPEVLCIRPADPGQFVQVLDERAIRIVHNGAALSIGESGDARKRPPAGPGIPLQNIGELPKGVFVFSPGDGIHRVGKSQRLFRQRGHMGSHQDDRRVRKRTLQETRNPDVVLDARRAGVHHDERRIHFFADFQNFRIRPSPRGGIGEGYRMTGLFQDLRGICQPYREIERSALGHGGTPLRTRKFRQKRRVEDPDFHGFIGSGGCGSRPEKVFGF